MLRYPAGLDENIHTDPRLNPGDRATLLPRQIAALIGTALFKGGRKVAAFGQPRRAARVSARR